MYSLIRTSITKSIHLNGFCGKTTGIQLLFNHQNGSTNLYRQSSPSLFASYHWNSTHLKSVPVTNCRLNRRSILQANYEAPICDPVILLHRSRSTQQSKLKDVLAEGTLGGKIIERLPVQLVPYASAMRIDKPTGTWLLLLPCWWSIALTTPSGCLPPLSTIGLFGLGAFMMRSAGCIVNDIWDRKFDSKVERTKFRSIASKQLSVFDALVLLQGLLGLSLLVLLQFDINRLVFGHFFCF